MIDRVIKQIKQTIIHKQYVLESASILSEYLILNGNFILALELLKRCSAHDDSKLLPAEISAFLMLNDNDHEALKKPEVELTKEQRAVLKLHWQNNSHHPEHFSDYSDMTDLDLLEMACDCNARSMQYGTDLLEFIEKRQNNRFHFPIDMYKKYKNYCTILVQGSKDIKEVPKEYIKK